MVALVEACDVTNNFRHLGRHLGILPKIRNQKEKKIEIRLKPREMVIFCALHEQ